MNHALVAIHQPNFLPWLGYFDKIRRADVFIAMDDAQVSKTGGSWTNRVQVIVNREPAWVTVPIIRAYHGTLPVSEVQIDEAQPWRAKLLKTIELSYGRAPYFEEVGPLVRQMVAEPGSDLARYNLTAIRTLCRSLGLVTPIVLGTSLAAEGRATDHLIAMVKAVGGSAYLAGGGAAGYQDDSKFAEAGVELVYQRFEHPVYRQFNTAGFRSGLSIVDALMNCGIDGVRRLLDERSA